MTQAIPKIFSLKNFGSSQMLDKRGDYFATGLTGGRINFNWEKVRRGKLARGNSIEGPKHP